MNTLEDLMERTGESWRKAHGGWPKGQVYNQNDPGKLRIARSYCVGCALTNSATAVNGLIGDNYPTMIYDRAKARRADKQSRPGISIEEGAIVAKEIFGGGETYRLRTLPEVIAWLSISPVICGFLWDEGMQYPHTKGGFFSSFFGNRWIAPVSADKRTTTYRHAVTIYGSTYKQGGFVKVENSEGRIWGNKGSARLSHDDLADMLERRDAHAYGIEWPRRPKIRK